MKNNFLSVSVLFWIIIGSVLWNLLYNDSFKGILDSEHILYFILICLATYTLGTIMYLQLTKKYKNVVIDIKNSDKRTYYESKTQYYFVSIIAFVVFSALSLFNIKGLSSVSIYFVGVSLLALVLVYFYRTSSFILSQDKFIWKKGFTKIECPWSDVIAIHHDIEPSLVNAGRKFKSSSFFIETKQGFTGYADLTNIKVKGYFTLLNQGNKLIEEIKLKSGSLEKAGDISMFKQTKKLKDLVLLLLGIFLIPVVIVTMYSFFTGFNLFNF